MDRWKAILGRVQARCSGRVGNISELMKIRSGSAAAFSRGYVTNWVQILLWVLWMMSMWESLESTGLESERGRQSVLAGGLIEADFEIA